MLFKKLLILALIQPFGAYMLMGQNDSLLGEMHSIPPLNDRIGNYLHTSPMSLRGGSGTPFFEAGFATGFKLINNTVKQGSIRYPLADLLLSTQIDIRMYNGISFPILPPNYEPILSYIRYFSSASRQFRYLRFDVAHLSNGQKGDFFQLNSEEFNHEDGNFSTNYVRLSFSQVKTMAKYRWFQTYGLQLNGGIPNTLFLTEEHLKNNYGQYRLLADLRLESSTFSIIGSSKKIRLIGSLENTYILGDLSAYPSACKARYSLKSRFTIVPANDMSIGFFFQYYVGRDYYNIRFDDVIDVSTLGFSYNL